MEKLKDITLLSKPKNICIDGELLDMSTPKIMGILNLTSDSFFDGGKYLHEGKMLEHTEKMIQAGAFIIDIGSQSTRPGAQEIGAEKEKEILIPSLKILKKHFPSTYFSIDTYHANVAQEAIESGAHIINDISGGQFDNQMFKIIARYKVPYILMHTIGKPDSMQQNPQYDNVLKEVLYFFSKKLNDLHLLGVSDIILDPGFGFGKTIDHNFQLLSGLEHFSICNKLILAGISRKSMIWKSLNSNPNNSLTGTIALNMTALQKGADILRVHDVQEAKETIDLFLQLKKNSI